MFISCWRTGRAGCTSAITSCVWVLGFGFSVGRWDSVRGVDSLAAYDGAKDLGSQQIV